MRGDDMLGLSLQCARLAVTWGRYESVLADGVAAILGTDAGTGVTTWHGTGADPDAVIELVVSGVAPFTTEHKAATLAVAARHPTFRGSGWSTRSDPPGQ